MERDIDNTLLEQLIPLLREPDFDDLFERVTHQEGSNSRFLIKMEINRLCTPCRRVIDMRDHFGELCQIAEYKGIQHAMPPEAWALFNSHCYLYRDQYTLGVYEALAQWQKEHSNGRLTSNGAAQLQPPESPLRQFDVKRVMFASYYGRREERMHFSSPVLLKTHDGERLFAKTSDLSVGGIKVQVPHLPPYLPGDELEVYFTGLERESPHPVLHQPVKYQILGESRRDDRIWLRLLRLGENREFDDFLRNFIDSNKSRYRVSVDYLLSAAIIKGYEQYYLPRMGGIPLFFGTGEAPRLEMALRTENNQGILEYWRDEHNRDMLGGLFTALRMQRLLKQPEPTKETVIYSFTHSVRSHIYFFSATREELVESGLRDLFFQVGARRPSWRVYRFIMEPCNLMEADISSLLPGEQGNPQDTLLQQRLKQIAYVGMLQQIDNELTLEDYQLPPLEGRNANELQRFGHPITADPFEVETLHYIQLRKERRYSHKTAVVLRYGGKKHLGWTRDISTHGLQIELEEGIHCQKDDVLSLSLPSLQELSKSMDLRNLAYRVVGGNGSGTVLHLCIDGAPERHVGRQFFTLLIESNQNKLKAVQEGRRYRGLARALRNLYTHHLYTVPFYVNKLKSGTRITAVGRCARPRRLDPLLTTFAEQEGMDNLAPLLGGEMYKSLVLDVLRERQREEAPAEQEVYIHLWQGKEALPQSECHRVDAFASREDRHAFVSRAVANGHFFSVRVALSRTGRPDTNFIANELDYIAKFAIHKARQLEEELWSVVGLGDLVDTTAATLFALGITPPDPAN